MEYQQMRIMVTPEREGGSLTDCAYIRFQTQEANGVIKEAVVGINYEHLLDLLKKLEAAKVEIDAASLEGDSE